MMPLGKLMSTVGDNAMRNRKQFVLSAFGIVIGIASFVFFLGLSMGVRNVVLGKIFPLERLEVVAPRASMLGVDTTKKLDDSIVEKLRTRPEVVQAVPRMGMQFPAMGKGSFEGQKIHFEAGGFVDGVDPSFLADESFGGYFQDWESDEHKAEQQSCGAPPTFECSDKDRYYCDREDNKCHHRVPVVVSRNLLEIYNSQFAGSHELPVIGSDLAKFIVDRGGIGKMKVHLYLGDTMVSGSNRNIKAPIRKVEGAIVGLSDKAMDIGVTVPIQYIQRWNREFVGEEAATTYSSIVVNVRDTDDIATFGGWLQTDLDLRLEDSMGERFALVILIVTALFILISLIIVSISAINIAHNLFMQVTERRREIGLLRALGATRADVRGIILGEAALVGVISGVIGVLAALGFGFGVNQLSSSLLPNFPYKPETYFDFQWWILLGGLLFSMTFCVLGGLLPARKAARMAPAQALAQR